MSSAAARVLDFSRAQAILADSELGVRRASTLERPSPEMVPTGVPAIDALTGGLPRGALTEIVGPASSGRTSLLLSLLAQATARQEACALVDASDAFDPESAVAAGIDLKRLLWVRCRVPESPSGARSLRSKGRKDRKEQTRSRRPRRAGAQNCRSAPAKWWLRSCGSGSQRRSPCYRSPRTTHLVVPLSPRRREHAHGPARLGAAGLCKSRRFPRAWPCAARLPLESHCRSGRAFAYAPVGRN